MAAVALELGVRNPATLERVGAVARAAPEDVPARAVWSRRRGFAELARRSTGRS